MSFNKIPLIGERHSDETRNIINLIVQVINNRGIEILSESTFSTWLEENGVKHQGEWDDTKEYDSLSVVLHEGNSYTSTKHVPAGIDILNEEFWVVTGNYNAQVDSYKEETEMEISDLRTHVDDELTLKVDGTTESINYYVSPGGNDNNDGSSETPFRTIKKAIDIMPDIIKSNHNYTINLEVGTFNEIVFIENKTIQGFLTIKGVTDDRGNHKITRLRANNINGHFNIENLTTTIKNGTATSYWFTNVAPYCRVINVGVESNPDIESDASGVIGLLADYGSMVHVTGSDFSGKRYGIRSNFMSKVLSMDNTGTGNTSGVGARWGGVVNIYGSHPKGYRSDLTTYSSGTIIKGRGKNMGLPIGDLYIIDQFEGGQDGRLYKKLYNINLINGLTVEIPKDGIIRIKMKTNDQGPHYIKINYGGQFSTSGYSEHIECVWTGTIHSNRLGSANVSEVFSNDFDVTNVTLTHAGSDFEYYIDIKTKGTIGGRWSVELETKIMRNNEAPALLDVEII